MKPLFRTALLLLPALATLGGGVAVLPLHDALGRLRTPLPLGAVVVEFEGDAEPAAAAARAAGANEVWMALPRGDARLPNNVRPDPGTLEAGADGRIRFDSSRRLPLPEALPAVMVLRAADLGVGTSARALAGQDVVLAWADHSVGYRESAPGEATPIDRARLLAVAVSSERVGTSLHTLALPLAAALAAGMGLVSAALLRRAPPERAWMFGALLAGIGLLASFIARASGWDLPVGALLIAPLLAAALRVDTVARAALQRIESALYRFGADAAESRGRTDFTAIVDALSLVAPDATIVVWEERTPGSPIVLAEETRLEILRSPATLPRQPTAGNGWAIHPFVTSEGFPGAIGIAIPDGVHARVREYLTRLCDALPAPAPTADRADPFDTRLALADAGMALAARRAGELRRLLGTLPGEAALFDPLGRLVSGNPPSAASGKALLYDHARALSPADAEQVERAVVSAMIGHRVVRLPGHDSAELALTPLTDGALHLGVLLQLHRRTTFAPNLGFRSPSEGVDGAPSGEHSAARDAAAPPDPLSPRHLGSGRASGSVSNAG